MKYFVIFLALITIFIISTNPVYAACAYDPTQPNKPCDDSSGTLIIETNQDPIENIDGVLYYVSESFMLESSSPEMVSFHDVIFTMPYAKSPPRYIYSNVTFSDGTKEILSVIHDEYDFTDHVVPQAGFKQNSRGFVFLVSAESAISKIPNEIEKIILPPLKQMKLGIKLGHIICDEDKFPTWNVHYKPACVFPESEGKLLTRGWAKLRLMLPASADPIKELEILGTNELTMRILGNLIIGDEPPPSTLDEKRAIAWEYAQKYHPGERFLEYSIPTSHMYHFYLGEKIQFDLLEWGNFSECWDVKLRIFDNHNEVLYEDTLSEVCLEPDGIPGTFNSYSVGKDFELVCKKPGYYLIEVSNGEIFPPTILQNFACLDTEPEPVTEEFTDEQICGVGNALVDGICVPSGWRTDEDYCSEWCDQNELYSLGCDKPILQHLIKYSNLLDEEFDGVYGIEDIGLPDGVSQEKFEKCVDLIYEKRTSIELENEN